MKKFFVLSLFVMFSTILFAQVEVTKFLGIPVDGTKEEMVSKLKTKGFTRVQGTDMFEGEFNGKNVYILIQTNNRKVWRIGLIDKSGCDETQIKINFNNLCHQFEENSKYIEFGDQTIPENENISYEMFVNSKRYEAVFFQKSPNVEFSEDKGWSNRMVWFVINESPKGYDDYVISLYYENGYNQANGEDL